MDATLARLCEVTTAIKRGFYAAGEKSDRRPPQ
jgi:hypothetical protein